MNTKLLLAITALLFFVIGVALIFLPQEIALAIGISPDPVPALFLQVMGSLYFALALFNWMSKGQVIGGIYARPLVIADLGYFTVAGLSLLKSAVNGMFSVTAIIIFAVLHVLFAILFGYLLFTHPVPR